MRPPWKIGKDVDSVTVQLGLKSASDGRPELGYATLLYAVESCSVGIRYERATFNCPFCAVTASAASRTGARWSVSVSGDDARARSTPGGAAVESSTDVVSASRCSNGRLSSCLSLRYATSRALCAWITTGS